MDVEVEVEVELEVDVVVEVEVELEVEGGDPSFESVPPESVAFDPAAGVESTVTPPERTWRIWSPSTRTAAVRGS